MTAPSSTPSPPQESDTLTVDGFAGLKNTVKPERLSAQELLRAVNIDLDDKGQAHRRRGYTLKIAGDCHSLFVAAGGAVYGVVDGVLSLINPNFSVVPLRPIAGDHHLCYCQVGDTIYFSSLQDSGKVVGKAALPWGTEEAGRWLSPVIHPTPTLAAIRGRLIGKPPMATSMAYFSGRIYMANGRQVWVTDLYQYDWVDKTRNFWTFESDITVLGAVGDGLYVGTTDGLWFVAGTVYEKMTRLKVLDSPVLAGSMVDIPSELANPVQVGMDAETQIKSCVAFLTGQGFCTGQDSGVTVNLTEDRLVFPTAETAAAMFCRRDGISQYIAVTDSGGSPSANTRIGDYVDATLIRNGIIVD